MTLLSSPTSRRACGTVSHLVLGLIVWVFALRAGAVGPIIYETATLGTTGQNGGWSVGVSTLNGFLGARFEVTSPVTTGSIGGHFGGSGTLFGALVALSGPSDFPDSGDLSTSDVLGVSLLTLPFPSDEVSSSLSVALTPGWYALVFGSELFGASGGGFAPSNNPEIGTPSYISSAELGAFTDSAITDARFFIAAVPEPSTAFLLGSGLISLAIRRRAR